MLPKDWSGLHSLSWILNAWISVSAHKLKFDLFFKAIFKYDQSFYQAF